MFVMTKVTYNFLVPIAVPQLFRTRMRTLRCDKFGLVCCSSGRPITSDDGQFFKAVVPGPIFRLVEATIDSDSNPVWRHSILSYARFPPSMGHPNKIVWIGQTNRKIRVQSLKWFWIYWAKINDEINAKSRVSDTISSSNLIVSK